MAVLIASDLAKDIAGSPLLRGVSLKLERRERLTIAGRNGAGKTTLLRMLAGETGVDGGELVLAKGTKVALHDQRPPRDRDISLREYVQSANKELIAQESRLAEMEQKMGTGDESVFDQYARLQTTFDAAGGYTWRERATQTIHGLGFTDESLDRSLSTFSGGQLTRASLARALAGTPDLLLLDEPTNHLDIESLEWLEKTLLDLDAAVILVAHDRWFLETVGTAVLEVEAGRTRFFPGTWAQWRREAAARELALGRAIDKQQKEIDRMEKFVERFRAKATKAKQAQSRVKALDKIERIERDPRDRDALSFQFAKPERTGRVIFELEDATVTIGERTLIEGGEMWLERGEHVTVVGANGTGKTTLIETLAGERELAGGKLRTGHNLKVGYLSQHTDTLQKDGARTILEATVKQTGLTPNKARSLLGSFLFTGEEAEKELPGLSGGERQRVSLAILVSSGANVLILDEPTNHLDLESREALEDALSTFEGALLLITHDRALLDAVGTRTIAVKDGTLHSYIGGWPEYLRARDDEREAGEAAKAAAKGKAKGSKAGKGQGTKRAPSTGAAKKNALTAGSDAATSSSARDSATPAPPGGAKAEAKLSKNARRRLQTLERETEVAEAALAALETELADPAAWATADATASSNERHTAAKREVEEAYARWEAAS